MRLDLFIFFFRHFLSTPIRLLPPSLQQNFCCQVTSGLHVGNQFLVLISSSWAPKLHISCFYRYLISHSFSIFSFAHFFLICQHFNIDVPYSTLFPLLSLSATLFFFIRSVTTNNNIACQYIHYFTLTIISSMKAGIFVSCVDVPHIFAIPRIVPVTEQQLSKYLLNDWLAEWNNGNKQWKNIFSQEIFNEWLWQTQPYLVLDMTLYDLHH